MLVFSPTEMALKNKSVAGFVNNTPMGQAYKTVSDGQSISQASQSKYIYGGLGLTAFKNIQKTINQNTQPVAPSVGIK